MQVSSLLSTYAFNRPDYQQALEALQILSGQSSQSQHQIDQARQQHTEQAEGEEKGSKRSNNSVTTSSSNMTTTSNSTNSNPSTTTTTTSTITTSTTTTKTWFLDHEAHMGMTPLILASTEGDLSTLSTLINRGVVVDYENRLGHTALSWSVICGHKEVGR